MIDMIKPYLTYIGILVITGILIYSHLSAYQAGQENIQIKFDAYKGVINDQLQTAINEKIRIEAEQNTRLVKAQLDYSESQRRLGDALKRLRDSSAVLRQDAMQVSGCCSGIMPRAAKNPTGATNSTEASTGTGSFTYENAMMDTLQCSRLIEFVK